MLSSKEHKSNNRYDVLEGILEDAESSDTMQKNCKKEAMRMKLKESQSSTRGYSCKIETMPLGKLK